MPPFLLGFPWIKIAATAALVIALVLGWHHYKAVEAENAQLLSSLTVARAAATANAVAAADIKRQAEKDLIAVALQRDVLAVRTQNINIIKGKVDNAPKSDNADVAPVLRAALDGLRLAGNGGSASGANRTHPAPVAAP